MNIYIPRRDYYSRDVNLDTCPECGAETIAEGSTVLLAVKSTTNQGEFMTNNVGSHFCSTCPVVIFDSFLVEQAAAIGIRKGRGLKYMILGMVDIDAIPEEKKHLEIGTDENPVPIVQFLPDLKMSREKRKSLDKRKPRKVAELLSSNKRVGKNQPCLCGSGKKYKRCCGKS